MAFTQDFRTQRRNYNDGETRIGEKDRLWYDSNTNTIRISDGVTPGGTVIGGGGTGGGDYTLPTASTTVKGGVKIDGTTITINNQVISGFSGNYTDLSNRPALFSGSYTDLTNKPTLFDGAYASLTGKPTLFSGSYNDLTDKPTIPGAYTLPTATSSVLGGVKIGSNITINAGVISVAAPFSGSYTDLTNKPTIPSLTGYATESYVTSQGYITSSALTGYATLTGEETLTNKTLTSPTITDGVFQDSFTIGNQVFYDHGYNGFSVNEDFDIVGESNFTGYHYTSGYDRDGVAFTLARTGQFTNGFGVWGSGEQNEFVIGSEYGNTDFLFKSGIGMPFDVSGGTTIFKIGRDGNLTFADETVQTTAWTGSIDQIIKVAGSFASDQPFKSEVISNLTDGVTINTWMGLPAFATTKSWKFGYNGNLTFPDTTVQTTAWTGSAPTLTTARNINGVSFNGSADITITAAAGTLTGNTLASGVTASSLTSVGTLTNLSVTNTITGSVSGSAATLTTARNINGVSFNGSAAINIPTLTDGTNLIKITAVPSALTGASGDVVGSVAFDSTYIYYCFQAFTGTSYSLPILSSGGLTQVTVNAGNSQTRIAIVAAFAATPAGWSYGGAPVTNITGSNQTIVITMSSGYSSFGNGTSYTLIQPPASANWKTTPWGAITSAAAGSLTGNTLASGVTASSLTSFGTTPAMTSPAITTSLTTPSTSFDLINTTATTVNFAGAATTLSVGASTGTTTVNNNLSMASGKTIGTTATVTSNHATAFSAGDSAISNVALSVPLNAAIRDRTNGASVIYFDVSNGGTTNGEFQFRSSSSFTNVLTMSPTAFNVNPDAVVTARTPSLARTAFNSAIDTELTVDEMRFRISNQGGIFPQVIGNTSTRNLAWTVVAARSGSAVTQAGSTGTIVANNAWTSLYTLGGMDSAGDTYTATLQDKAMGRIYRVTFMRSDNGANTGYNIIAERLL